MWFADLVLLLRSCFFFFNAAATSELYTLSLHDALPIYSARAAVAGSSLPGGGPAGRASSCRRRRRCPATIVRRDGDRKSTRLNSSHPSISYAVFCLKKKKNKYLSKLSQLPASRTQAAHT